ncbi:MAG: type II toxin-antitoxin system VapC family toxin [Planctomycetes bacterium]|nr:type II toxin-antitoxin system VapC family toxin [Planctomycetota bacterium]
MKSVYIETTVVSYYVARPSRDVIVAARQESTRELWPRFASEYDSYVSILVYDEAAKGEEEQASLRLQAIAAFTMLETDEAARELASKIIAGHGIPEDYPEDALHIAIAAINGMDVLVTWNYAPFIRIRVRQIVEQAGYQCPEICSPDELLEITP